MPLAVSALSDEQIRDALRKCIDDCLQRHAGVAPTYADDTSLLSLGLDSLAAASLAVDLGEAFDVALPDDAVIDYPTVRELVVLIRQHGAGARVSP